MGGETKDKKGTSQQYVFSSSPTVPRQKPPDILVQFRAASESNPCLESRSFYISSRSTLVEVRRAIHGYFASCYEKGFVFLRKNREVRRSRERITRLVDILPILPRSADGTNVHPTTKTSFRYPGVQYKKLWYDTKGRRYHITCAGLVFLYEDSGVSYWAPEELRASISARTFQGFSFVPWTITSAKVKTHDLAVDTINACAAEGKKKDLLKAISSISPETEIRLIRDHRSATPLHYAAQNGHLDICEMLIGRLGRDMIYMKDVNLRTPLHCALNSGKTDVTTYLLQLSPDLECLDVYGLSCYRMIFTLKKESAEDIMSRFDPALLDDTLILHFTCFALQIRNLTIAGKLAQFLKAFRPSFLGSPLHMAAEIGDKHIIEVLLEKKGDAKGHQAIENAEVEQNTNSEGAVQLDDTSFIHDPSEKDPNGHLPFHYACQHGNDSILPLLYFSEMLNDDFMKGMKLALEWNKMSILETIVDLREDYCMDLALQQTMLNVLEKHFSNMATYLVPCFKNEKMLLNRFVSQAASHGELGILKWLISQGASVDMRDYMGRTPLHEAAVQGQVEAVRLLLESGADPNQCDWRRSTPLHYSCMSGNIGTAQSLLQHEKTVPDLRDSNWRTPLLVAAYHRKPELVDFLVQNHLEVLDPHAEDIYRHSLLHFLPYLRLETVVSFLQKLPNTEAKPRQEKAKTGAQDQAALNDVWCDRTLTESKSSSGIRKRSSVKVYRMKCKKCGKLWSAFGKRKRWFHICKKWTDSEDEKHQSPDSQPTFSKEEDAVVYQTVTRPFQITKGDFGDNLSIFNSLILSGKPKVLQEVLNLCPKLIEGTGVSAAVFAAKYWCLDSLLLLNGVLNLRADDLCVLLHISLIRKPDTDDEHNKQILFVKCLLEMGASPNYFPQTTELHKQCKWTDTENKFHFCCPLEIVVWRNDPLLVDLLLKHGASAKICFAAHLAAFGGNADLLNTLLSHRRTSEAATLQGHSGKINELQRVCNKGLGVLQAACCSRNLSKNTFCCIKTFAPDLLESPKIVTYNMVKEIRPDLDIASSSSPFKNFLFRISEQKGLSHSLLPLTYLLKCSLKYVDDKELEDIACYIIKSGIKLDDIRVSKKSTVHVICEAFVQAIERKLWKVVDALLAEAGETLWDCLLSKHHSCHKYTYKGDGEPCPVLLPLWQTLFRHAPLETNREFFRKGKSIMKKQKGKILTRDILKQLQIKGGDDTDKEVESSAMEILAKIGMYHCQKFKPEQGGSIMCSKILLCFPKLFDQIMIKIHSTPKSLHLLGISVSHKNRTITNFRKSASVERRLLFAITRLTQEDVLRLLSLKLSLLHFATVLGDASLVEACIEAVDPLPLDIMTADGSSLLDLASGLGMENMVEVLRRLGALPTQQTFVAACGGKTFVKFLSWRYQLSPGEMIEEKKLCIVRNLCRSSEIDAGYHHKVHGTVFTQAVACKEWQLVEYLLDNIRSVSELAMYPRMVFLPVFSKGPTHMCYAFLNKCRDALQSVQTELQSEILLMASKRVSDDVVDALLKVLANTPDTTDEAKKISQLVSWQDSHGETFLHSICKNGKDELLSYVLDKLGADGYENTSNILNVEDKSGATSLWYALAGGHWSCAGILLMYGGGMNEKRAVPDFCPKRTFTLKILRGTNKGKWKENPDRIQTIPQKQHKDDDKQNVKYLLSLWRYSKTTSSTMLHAAVSCGDVKLVEVIMSLSVFSSMAAASSCYSPLVSALINHQYDAAVFCLEHEIKSSSDEPLLEAAGVCIFDSYGITSLLKNIQQQLGVTSDGKALKYPVPRWNTDEETKTALLNLANSSTVMVQKLKSAQNVLTDGTKLRENEMSALITAVLKESKGQIPDVFILVLAVLGKPWMVRSIQTAMDDQMMLAEIFQRKLVSRFSCIDLLFSFAKYCSSSAFPLRDCNDRCETLSLISKDVPLNLETQTIKTGIKKNIFRMLETIVNNHIHNDTILKPFSEWQEVLYGAAKWGLSDMVRGICQQLKEAKSQITKKTFHRALCISCLNGSFECARQMLKFDIPLSLEIQNLPSLWKPGIVLDCAILSRKVDVVDVILEHMKDQQYALDTYVCQHSLQLASVHAQWKVLESVMASRKFANSATRDFCGKLFVMAARNGNEEVCLQLLSKRHVDVLRTDQYDYNAMHYACLFGMEELAGAILKNERNAVQIADKNGLLPLDLARLMGSTTLSLNLITKHNARPSKKEESIQTIGWMKHLLRNNASQLQAPSGYMSAIGKHTRKLEIISLIRRQDDKAAHAVLQVGQESVVDQLDHSYQEYPLLHLCAQYGCSETLILLVELLVQFSSKDLSMWLEIEHNSKVPLICAIENKHLDCVKILFAGNKCFDWKHCMSMENVTHYVAKAGQTAIAEHVLLEANDDLFLARDIRGLTSKMIAVALGHHDILQYLRVDTSVENDEHSSHNRTVHSCLQCLFDSCIGWSKIFLGGKSLVERPAFRNIFVKKKSLVGYVLNPSQKTKYYKYKSYVHPIQTQFDWFKESKTAGIVFAGLSAMGYASEIGIGQLFLLLNKVRDPDEIVTYALRIGMEEAACYLYENKPMDDKRKVLQWTLDAAAYGRATFLKTVLKNDPEIANQSYDKVLPSLLDVALGFGNISLAHAIEESIGHVETSNIGTLLSIKDSLPVFTRWRIGVSFPGDAEWNASIENNTSPISLADALLVSNFDEHHKQVMEGQYTAESMIPDTFMEKTVAVDFRSFEKATETFGISDLTLRAVIASKLILGRYQILHDNECSQWTSARKIAISCLPRDSPDRPEVVVTQSQIRDKVKVLQVNRTTHTKICFTVETAELSDIFEGDEIIRKFIESTTVPQVENLMKTHLLGHAVKIKIDWKSVDMVKEKYLKTLLLKLLTGDVSNNPLGGLHEMVFKSGAVIKDMLLSYGVDTANNALHFILPVKEIVVQYVETMHAEKSTPLTMLENKLIWKFTIKDNALQYRSSSFALYRVLKLYHSACICIHQGVYVFEEKQNDFLEPDKEEDLGRSVIQKVRMELKIDLKSFEEIGLIGNLFSFFSHTVRPEIRNIGQVYKTMLRLTLSVKKVVVKATTLKEKSGIKLLDETLMICLHVTRSLSGSWTLESLNVNKVFTEMEVKQVLKTWNPDFFDAQKEILTKAITNLPEDIGLSIDFPIDEKNWLEDVVKADDREMTHPYQLLKTYIDCLIIRNTCDAYSVSVSEELHSSWACWYMGEYDIPPGVWYSIKLEELSKMTESSLVLMLTFDDKMDRTFKVLNSSQISEIATGDIFGFWQHRSLQSIPMAKNIQFVSIHRCLFFVTDVDIVRNLVAKMPRKVEIVPRTEKKIEGSHRTLKLSFAENFLSLLLPRSSALLSLKNEFSAALKSRWKSCAAIYECWEVGRKLGINISFDLKAFDNDSSLNVIGYIVLLTLKEISGFQKPLSDEESALVETLAKLETVTIGFTSESKERDISLDRIEGRQFDEYANIVLISNSNLYINFKPAILSSGSPLEPFTETLKSALCFSFEVQSTAEMVEYLTEKLKKNVGTDNVHILNFHTREEKEIILHGAKKSLHNFNQALNYVLETHKDARKRLAAELMRFELKENSDYRTAATFQNGVLQCSVFRDGEITTEEEIREDLVQALTDASSVRSSERFHFKSLMPLLRGEGPPSDDESCLTLTTEEKQKRQIVQVRRLKRPKATSRFAEQRATERLFDFVDIGHTGNIENVLDVGADINATDSEGFTPLIRAARGRNYVVQDLLLAHGAKVNKRDKFRRTALHYEAGHGDMECLKLLLARGANVNTKDRNGRTSLHYAVIGHKAAAADILVFCGADGSIKDKARLSPTSLCDNMELKQLMTESKSTVYGIQNGYVHIEHAVLEANSTYNFQSLGLGLRTPPSLGTGNLTFTCRRVRPEYSGSDLVPKDRELLMSDVFEYRISGSEIGGSVIMKVPVYAKPEMFEDVYMKTDRGDYIGRLKDIRLEDTKKQWVCYVKVKLSQMNAFVFVTLPRLEKFPVTSAGGAFISAADDSVEVKIAKNTFVKNGTLNLEIIPMPAFDEEEFGSVLSLSNFYDVSYSEKEQPQKDVIMTVPLPHDYLGVGDLYVLIHHETDSSEVDDEEEQWEILEKNPPIRRGLVTISIPHFSECNLMEWRAEIAGEAAPEAEIIFKNARLLEKAKRRECSVVFIGMLKPLPDSECEAVIECTRNTRLSNRLNHWKMEGYTDQKPSFTSEFVTFPRQEFKLDIGGNAKKVNPVLTKLQYHPKRDNVLKFPISSIDEDKEKVGWLNIKEKQENLQKQFESNPSYDNLAKILLYLFGHTRPSTKDGKGDEHQAKIEERAFEGFTDKNLLKDLAKNLEREWLRVVTLLGFSKKSIAKLSSNEELTAEEIRLKVLTVWRDRRLHRRDHGVPELLIALQRSGRRDLVKYVIDTLKEWLDQKKERQDLFYSWLETVLDSSSKKVTEGLLEPMTDEFLIALVEEMGVVMELAKGLDISKPEIDLIMADPLTTSQESKMLKILMASRDKQDTRVDAFQLLKEAMDPFENLTQIRNWMCRISREWLNNVDKTGDPFVHALSDYLDEVWDEQKDNATVLSGDNDNEINI